MPAGRRQQSNAPLYTLITFVGLFIVAATVAVIFYIKAEKLRTTAATSQRRLEEMASPAEQRRIGELIGAKVPRKSRLGTMLDYLDTAVYSIVGGLPEETSAEVKVDTADRKIKEILELLAQQNLATKSVTPKTPDNEFVELLVTRQFSATTENLDEEMKNALPPEKLEEIWKSTTSQIGPFKQQIGLRTEKELGYDIMLITCEFEKGHLDIKLVYNDKNQIAGLFFVPTPPEVLESYRQTLKLVTREQPYIQIDDPNTIGLIQVIEKLTAKLDNTTTAAFALAKQLEQLQKRFDDAVAIGLEKEQMLLAEKEKYQQQVDDIAQDYSDLKDLVQQTSAQQVRTLVAQLDEEKTNNKMLRQQLLKTQAELKITEDRMKRAQQKLQELVPPPDSEIAAYKPDGEIILIDEAAGMVHLNIGSDDHVYRGLTFSVYDKNIPVPRHGRGKAEIEVLSVGKKTSTARIIPSEDFEKALNKLLAENIDITTVMLSLQKPQQQRAGDFEEFAEGSPDRLKILNNLATAYDERGSKRTVMLGDIVANLIWDSDKANVFVVVGGFDLDGDGNTDRYAGDKIKSLIKEWDGRVDDTVTIDTDFLVLGRAPEMLRKPTFEEMEVDPMAMRKYEDSLQKLDHYEEVLKLAKDLSIPIFNTERFLCFIGYKTQAGRF